MMLLCFCIALSLIGVVGGQSNNQFPNCPSPEEQQQCKSFVKELSETTTTPIHNVFTSDTFFITPLQWNRWEVEQICRHKTQYMLFLNCSVTLRKECQLPYQKEPFMNIHEIRESINFLCDLYRCDDCIRFGCKQCDPTYYFDFNCAATKIPELSACMQPYENRKYNPASSITEREEWHRIQDYNEWQCELVNHHRYCTREAYRSCSFYTSNFTHYFTEFNRPWVCAASSHFLSLILMFVTILSTTIL